jgi:Protein of unknown function (DUF1592)/Protein of unknown function (DUF1588)/Protein of unknown function (DUF1587)/Protein of unknown function (DUF1595)/Protein of unknown function (DUF1585)
MSTRLAWTASIAAAALLLGMQACSGRIGDEGNGTPGDPSDPSKPGGQPGTVPGPSGLPGASLAAVSGLRRLTATEYDNTLRDLLGDSTRPSGRLLPADARIPFDNDYTVQVPSRALVDGLELLARESVDRVMADPARLTALLGCKPTGPGDAKCFRTFITTFGRRALRRSLASAEVTRWQTTFLPFATDAMDFNAAVATALQAFLQHAELVYRVEVGTPLPSLPGVYQLNSFEMGTRLSYLLWGGPPDDSLLDDAEANRLGTAAGLRTAATRMLKDPRAQELVSRFHALWLKYEGLATGSAALDQAMQEETRALLTRVIFEERRPWQDLFRLGETFASDALRAHYGLPASGSGSGSGLPGWVGYGATGRQGLLSHGTFLSNGTKGGDTSPTMRGLTVRELLMCDEIPPPPPGVDSDTPPPGGSVTPCKEDRYTVHRQGGCASCHALMDPIGFGLENFDQQGRYRTTEPGRPACAIRGQGDLSPLGAFRGPAELSNLLLQSGKLNACVVKQLYRFTMGRQVLDDSDGRFVALLSETIGGGASTADFKFDDLILDFVSSEAFRHRREEK